MGKELISLLTKDIKNLEEQEKVNEECLEAEELARVSHLLPAPTVKGYLWWKSYHCPICNEELSTKQWKAIGIVVPAPITTLYKCSGNCDYKYATIQT